MGGYRNFKLVVYFVASGTNSTTEAQLNRDIAFFKRYLRLDKVYLEPFRDGVFAPEEQVRMCKRVFEENGVEVAGGITTTYPGSEGANRKRRLFNTFCYNDKEMTDTLAKVSELNGRIFDSWIIDDFYFTNCTCEACRKGRDEYNLAHGITDGSWEGYRQQLMMEASAKYMIAPSKKANPDCRITIKFPNWMESFQETGYDPMHQKDIFDMIYTGTETRDPVHTDQHLPRYLSFSLMRYFEALAPGKNGGGWFDPYDCKILEYYLEQAYLTAFSKPREMTMFCFQSLVDTVNIPALGFMLDKLDDLMDKMGDVVGVPCYIPNASQGEDNVQDYLGMHGFPIVTTPYFPKDASAIFLTASSACDPEIVDKVDKFVSAGGKAIVTSGFIKATLDRGIKRMTSLRDRNRKVAVRDFATERLFTDRGLEYPHGVKEITVPVLEFRNNATWGGICKGIRDEESYTLLARDTYGKGEMITLCVPEAYSDFKFLPGAVLSRMRREFAVNGVYIEGAPMISAFMYDNDSFIIYPYADRDTQDTDIFLHVRGAEKLTNVTNGSEIAPIYRYGSDSVFCVRARVGKFEGYKIARSDEVAGDQKVRMRSDGLH